MSVFDSEREYLEYLAQQFVRAIELRRPQTATRIWDILRPEVVHDPREVQDDYEGFCLPDLAKEIDRILAEKGQYEALRAAGLHNSKLYHPFLVQPKTVSILGLVNLLTRAIRVVEPS
jgi:hypothetical protein